METKTYKIGKVVCKLKEDLTLGEAEKIEKLQAKFTPVNNEIRGNFTYDEIKEFICSIVEPVDDNLIINPEDIKVKQSLKIIADFFLTTIKELNATENFLQNLIESTKQQVIEAKDLEITR